MTPISQVVVLLSAAVIAVPLLKRIGLASVMGYLVAGVAIGPWGLALLGDPETIMHTTEFGVVLLLFIIGLELQPARLWVLRRVVFGLGGAQVALTTIAIALIAWVLGLAPLPALITGLALSMSSTAFVLQMLAEKKQLTTRFWARRICGSAISGSGCHSAVGDFPTAVADGRGESASAGLGVDCCGGCCRSQRTAGAALLAAACGENRQP